MPRLKKVLTDDRQEKNLPIATLLCDEKAYDIIGGDRAGENDFDTEFLDYKLAIGVVENVDEAIEHISKHSTGHSESILSQNKNAIERFTTLVDSSCVYVNSSTRFTDGGEFGLGCERGISTQKLNSRGPMGLEGLNP